MICADSTIVNQTLDFHTLETKMKQLGFVRWSWDYKKAIYDKKFIVNSQTYYLRIRGNVIGEILLESPKAVLKLEAPMFVEHFFPHGLDDSVAIPEELREDVQKNILDVETTIAQFDHSPRMNAEDS